MEAAFWYLVRLLRGEGWGRREDGPELRIHRARVALMEFPRCECDCHACPPWGVSATDPIEAVTACRHCIDNHVPALTFKPPEHWDPSKGATGDEPPEG